MKRLAAIAIALAAACGGSDNKVNNPPVFTLDGPGAVVAGVAVTYKVTVTTVSGVTNSSYRGTVHFASSDTRAVLPADYTFTAADAGVHSFSLTFKTAGGMSLSLNDTSTVVGSLGSINVSPAAATSLAMTGITDASIAGDNLVMTLVASDPFGNVATGYTGTVHFSSSDASAQLPADYTFVAADKGSHIFGAMLAKAGSSTVAATDATHSLTATASSTVKHAGAAKVTLEGVPTDVTADTDVQILVTVRDAFGNPVTNYAGTLHFVLTDGSPLADVTFTAAMLGATDITARFSTAEDQSIIARDTTSAAVSGSAATKVKPGTAVAYTLSSLPTMAVAGEPLPLSITAVDVKGNVVKDYAGTAHVSSADPTDRLPANGTFTSGVRIVSLAFVTAAPAHSATVSEVGGAISKATSAVTIVSDDAIAFAMTGGAAAAGTATTTTVTAKDTFNNTVSSFSGTVTLTSSDAQATLPAAFTYGNADAGAHSFSFTLKTAGAQSVTASSAGITASAGFTVSPADAATCVVADAPASAAAGSQVALRVLVRDAYANLAAGYGGTMALSSSDASAQLGSNGTFTATDGGSHAFSVQLRTAGSQSVTATDTANTAISCSTPVTVVPGATVLDVSFTGLNAALDAWAGTAVSATITAQDSFANRVSTYGGTVGFTSSDAAATLPAAVTFGAGDNGQKTVTITFNTVGTQTVTAKDAATAAIQGASKGASVHGLVYTNPASGGKVRLVQGAGSNASVVQLDLVSNATLFALTLGSNDTVRNGVFAAGMNLPLDTSKVGPDTSLLVTTAPNGSSSILSLGTGVQAKAAAINAANAVLYSGISQKRIDITGTNGMRGDVSVRPFPGSASYYYSVRLKLTPGAAVGTVFDGQSLSTKFHAAVRDRSGTDVFAGPDFAIGKLEVR